MIGAAVVLAGALALFAGTGKAKAPVGHWVVHDLGARVDVGSGDGGFYPGEAPTMAVNARGQVIGTQQFGFEGDRSRAFLWSDGHLTYLPPLPGDNRTAAFAINDRGTVVGASWKEVGFSGDEHQRAVIWEHGRVRDLGVPRGALATRAMALDGRGRVVGSFSAGAKS